MFLSREKLLEIIKNPYKIIKHFGGLNHFKWLSDETYLKICYKAAHGKWPNLDNPKSFNEKLNWLKLYDRKKVYTTMVDKCNVKSFVADIIGEEHIIPTLGIWERIDDIDFDSLPNQFVLKCTHDSGSTIIIKDKKASDIRKIKKAIQKNLKRDFFYVAREWPYKNIKAKIIAEEYLTDESNTELKDYKLFCFNGEPRIIQVDYNRFIDHKRNLYDTEWNEIDAQIEYPSDKTRVIAKPRTLNKLLELSKKLSFGIPFVRTDFYCVDDKVFFGELTFYPGAGFEKIHPENFDEILGRGIKLPKS